MAVNLLLSYAFHADTNLDRIRASLVCGRLMIDSGAFTAHSLGKQIDRTEYAEYLERWAGVYDYAISLDVIGDPAGTKANTRWLHERGIPVMPVFTTGDSLAEFDAMVRESRYVCVGGLVGMPKPQQEARIKMLQRRAVALGGGIHTLGVGSLGTLARCRPFSADSSAVSGSYRFGTVVVFTGRAVTSIAVTDRAKLTKHREALRAHGIDLAGLVRSGRMPGGPGRHQLTRAMSVAYAVADEYLKRNFPVPSPWAGGGGVHLYSAIMPHLADSAADLDTDLHGPDLYMAFTVISAPQVAEVDAQLHGPNLYNAYTAGATLEAAPADALLHGPNLYQATAFNQIEATTDEVLHERAVDPPTPPPPVWRTWAAYHQHTARYLALTKETA